MEHFVLVPASVYNKSLTTQSITKQEFPEYQTHKIPRSNLIHLRGDKQKIIFQSRLLVDKILSCPRIELSIPQTLILDGVEIRISLLDFAQQLRCKKAEVPDIYFTLLDAAGISPTLILNRNVKAKEKGSWVPFEIWTAEA